MSNIAVDVKDIKKSFYLPHYSDDSLKTAITQVFKSKQRGGEVFNALDGISFKVEKGDFFGILGRNGSGKSTLLKIISEIYQPTSGSVTHSGKVVSFIELGVGFKPQLTGRENVFLNGALLGFSKLEIEDMYDDIVEFAELEKFMDQKLKNYSSGMKVRLAFSVAIRAKADVLILDEVLAVGDAAFQRKCNDYFRTLMNKNKTVILVTHSMSAVREYCNKAILIEGGKIAFQGSAEEAADEYLRLFNKPQYEKEQVAKQRSEQSKARWGGGAAEVAGLSATATKNKITISVTVHAHRDLDNVTIAIDIFNSKRALVGGIDDGVQEMSAFPLKAGAEKTISYTFDNILGRGEYTLNVSLRPSDKSETYDFWRDATRFQNRKSEFSEYFPVAFPVQVDVAD